MKNKWIEKLLQEISQNIDKKPCYRDIAFIVEDQKQYKAFEESLRVQTGEEISKEEILLEIGKAYIEFKDNSNATGAYLVANENELSIEEREKIILEFARKNLKILGNIMTRSKAIEFQTKKYNKKYMKVDSALEVKAEDVINQFSEEKLKRKSPSELFTMLAFWTNKFIKYIDVIEEAYMYAKDTEEQDLSYISTAEEDKILYQSYQKKRVIEKICQEAETEQEKEQLIVEYSASYTQLFGEGTSLEDDYADMNLFERMKQSLYVSKNMTINRILIDRINEIYANNPIRTIKNWGIQEDPKYKSKYIVIIELPGYLLPVTIHMPKVSISKMLKENDISKISFPEYKTQSDFTTQTGEYLGASIMVQATDVQAEAIRKAAKKNRQNKTLQHIRKQVFNEYQQRTNTELEITSEER